MTTLVLQAAGALAADVAGRAVSTLVGGAMQGALGGGGGRGAMRTAEGPRLTEMAGLASTEGAPIPRVYGRARVGGELIWATRFEEVANTTTERTQTRGGKGGVFGGSRGRAGTTTVTTTYSYNANLAVGLCEGPISFVRRVWADGQELDLTLLTMRVHRGDEAQTPDPLIVAKEGAAAAPAYRGLAYVVFEKLPLGSFGNRVPQFSFEVVRAIGRLAPAIRSVCLIPGATEFGYATTPVSRTLSLGASAPENRFQLGADTDVEASLDQLQALCPNLETVSVVVTWFGDDLRAGHCTVAPRVDLAGKVTSGAEWGVAGLTRATAREVSRPNGVAAYGGTPSDGSVVALIQALKARGLGVTLYPFVMMDVPAANDRVDPRTGVAPQPPYPWRGRITCDPAPERPGTVDGTLAAADQVAGFFGAAGGAWSFGRLIRHYAGLAAAAGGVDGFVVGSELVGLTRVRSGPGTYPAVAHLRGLAVDAKAILGPATRIVYAADWTEYGAHVRAGGAEVRFPLDPLWADPAIDAVGIDWYPPITDWRDGPDHLDARLAESAADPAYLRERLGSGEAFDWFYANDADRLAQSRSPITDGAYGKPWTFRAKDLAGWWSNAHVERAGGVEIGPTGWTPCAKPVWLTEIGVPAVDKGANGPNVFPDPKSSESASPPFSSGVRDDLVQARALGAILARFDPALPGHDPAANPLSPVYGGRMVDPARVSVWAWDARPFPVFPDFEQVWADGANWRTGHWITGRLEGAPLDELLGAILAEYGLAPQDAPPLDGFLDGYVLDRSMSARDALEPLCELFGFDIVVREGRVHWRGRRGGTVAALAQAELVAAGREPIVSRRRAHETDLPASLELHFVDGDGDYARATVGSRRLAVTSRREGRLDVAATLGRDEARRLVEARLQDAWSGRDVVEFTASPRRVELEVGDLVRLEGDAASWRITRIADGAGRRVTAESVDMAAAFHAPSRASTARRHRAAPPMPGPAAIVVLDLAVASADAAPLQYLAVAADPWPGRAAIWRASSDAAFALHAFADLPAVVGRTRGPFRAGPLWRWDDRAVVEVEWSRDAVASVDDRAALGGGNLLAVEGEGGRWEIVSAARAELVAARTSRLSRFLRGLAGSEAEASRDVPAGARVVRLDDALVPLTTSPADLGRTYRYRVGPAERDPVDPVFVELSATVGPAALTPLAPVRLTARRVTDAIEIGWIRRTRIGGDAWEPMEVPLGEAIERYDVAILRNDALVRTLDTGEARVLYPSADEIADFGAPQTALAVRVRQLSASVGPGAAALASLSVP